jgi:hypothetical protein
VISRWRQGRDPKTQGAVSDTARPAKPSKPKPPNPQQLAERLETLRGLCFCALFDLCSWLAGARQGVGQDTPEYSLNHLRQVVDPRQRLQYYMNPQVLVRWDQVLQPFFATDVRMAPELGDSASLSEEGLEKGRPVRVELRFNNRSSLVAPGQPRQPMPREEWALTLWVSADLTRIDDAVLRPVEPDPGP